MGNVPSTIISVKVVQTEGRTWRRPSIVEPIDIRSATVCWPSRMSFRRVSFEEENGESRADFLEVIGDQCL